MRKLILKSLLSVFLTVITAAFALCSCSDIGKTASGILSQAVESAANEISGAFEDGMSEFSEGMNELSNGIQEGINAVTEGINEGLGELSQGLKDAQDELADNFGNIGQEISEQISSGISEAAGEIIQITSETTVSPESVYDDGFSVEPGKRYTFRNKTRYNEHYDKHGSEFGSITKEQYLDLANELIHSTSSRVLHKISEDGDYLWFDQDSGHYLVMSEDGYIRTFFIPTAGKRYYDKQ